MKRKEMLNRIFYINMWLAYACLSYWLVSPSSASSSNRSSKFFQQQPPCVFEFNSSLISHGEVYSPNYPNSYPNNLNCRYEFYAKENERVIIHVDDFQLEPPQSNTVNDISLVDFVDVQSRSNIESKQQSTISSTTHRLNILPFGSANHHNHVLKDARESYLNANKQCFYDFLDIFTADGQGRMYWRSRHCGTQIDSQIVSTSPNIILVFQTDRMLSYRGFKLRFYFSYLNILPFVTQPNCGPSELQGNGSILQSPNYPLIFPSNTECAWAITVGKNQRILVKFIDLNLNQPCEVSSVSMWDGYVSDITRPDKLACEKLAYNKKSLMIYKSKTNRLVIKFTGNKNFEALTTEDAKNSRRSNKTQQKNDQKILNGFKLSWTAISLQSDCKEFQCKGGEYCIDSKNVICQPTYKYCISKSLVCDGVLNCDHGDDSDEKNCEITFLKSKLYMTLFLVGGAVFSLLTLICFAIHCFNKKRIELTNKFSHVNNKAISNNFETSSRLLNCNYESPQMYKLPDCTASALIDINNLSTTTTVDDEISNSNNISYVAKQPSRANGLAKSASIEQKYSNGTIIKKYKPPQHKQFSLNEYARNNNLYSNYSLTSGSASITNNEKFTTASNLNEVNFANSPIYKSFYNFNEEEDEFISTYDENSASNIEKKSAKKQAIQTPTKNSASFSSSPGLFTTTNNSFNDTKSFSGTNSKEKMMSSTMADGGENLFDKYRKKQQQLKMERQAKSEGGELCMNEDDENNETLAKDEDEHDDNDHDEDEEDDDDDEDDGDDNDDDEEINEEDNLLSNNDTSPSGDGSSTLRRNSYTKAIFFETKNEEQIASCFM